jgi:hypothetical protein
MVITLKGWLQHRELHNLAALCAEHRVTCPSGYFTDTEFITEDDIESGVAELIAATFSPKTQAEKDTERKSTILTRLSAIDTERIRPLAAIATQTAVQFDHDKLAALEEEAATLRAELATLGGN